MSKALDAYIGETYGHILEQYRAETQFKVRGSCHDLASLLLTETIQVSLNLHKKSLYALYLDAMSAFDLVLRQFLVKNLYHYGNRDQALLLIDQRLRERRTSC